MDVFWSWTLWLCRNLIQNIPSSCAVKLVVNAITQSPQSCYLYGSAVAVVAAAADVVGYSGVVLQCESVWRQMPAS